MSVGQEAPAAPRSFPWRWLVLGLLAAVALALAVVALAGYLWPRSYTPAIRMAGTAAPLPGSLEFEVVLGHELEERTTYVASGREDGSFGVIFDVVNTGQHPITIEGLGGETHPGSLLPRLELHRSGEPGAGRLDAFAPETLERGERMFLGLEVVADNTCENSVRGGSINWDSVTLRSSYAGVEREGTLDLPIALSLVC
ncbi:MAG TPA: hypothetical protein VD769_13350 [Gaiellaceae bacterium]|nr:hypothetical protein [Gaiellaceae bacterium]